ncbi:MAG: phosphoribosyltransferase [Candidatus Helarchaeota archaeon]|nr:phosphoribosyltransferase [Candidatus Helarchaeota archaeon]
MFRDRRSAGETLAELLKPYTKENVTILAIPNGGVPVAFPIFKNFRKRNPNVEFQLLIVRKIQIPYNTEAGFGAITLDGTIILNEMLVARIGLNEEQIQRQASKTLKQIEERLKRYGIESQEFDLKNKVAILVDDGLASGFTMLAAVNSIKKFDPEKIVVAVPTAPRSSVERVAPLVDDLICPNIRDTLWFAVADAYKNWYDLEIDEVRGILEEVRSMDI